MKINFEARQNVQIVDISNIAIHPKLASREPDEAHVKFIAASIAAQGLHDPICVCPKSAANADHYYIADGIHRFLAVQSLGWQKVACLVLPYTEGGISGVNGFIGNTFRKGFSVLEQATLIDRMKTILKVSTDEALAKALGVDAARLRVYTRIAKKMNHNSDLGTALKEGDAELKKETGSTASVKTLTKAAKAATPAQAKEIVLAQAKQENNNKGKNVGNKNAAKTTSVVKTGITSQRDSEPTKPEPQPKQENGTRAVFSWQHPDRDDISIVVTSKKPLGFVTPAAQEAFAADAIIAVHTDYLIAYEEGMFKRLAVDVQITALERKQASIASRLEALRKQAAEEAAAKAQAAKPAKK